jgi:hypothetical protein
VADCSVLDGRFAKALASHELDTARLAMMASVMSVEVYIDHCPHHALPIAVLPVPGMMVCVSVGHRGAGNISLDVPHRWSDCLAPMLTLLDGHLVDR